MSDISKIIADPLGTLKNMSTKKIVEVLEKADEAFFNTSITIFPDDIYDVVKDFLRDKDPDNPYLKKVGAEVIYNKEKLPFYMGSLDKIRDNEDQIKKWAKKYPGSYVVSEKLDGISCLLCIDKGNVVMYTRGNGIEGQNISHILPYITGLNISKLKNYEKLAIRGELIISKKKWSEISDIGANARNVVAGAIHSKTINNTILSRIDFVAYDLMYPKDIKLSDGLHMVKGLDVSVTKYVEISDDLSLETLSKLLQDWRTQSKYEIDGIVVYHNAVHKLVSGQNPKYAFAFKTIHTHQQVEVVVTDVEWNVSKHRYLKPIVKFSEVVLDGVKIKQATGFNAAFIEKHKIGPGSRVIIIRSGDVIPHILSVLTLSASGKAKMPDNYVWNESHIDILLAGNEKNRDQDIQVFTHFMKTLGIEGVKEGILTKLYDAGFDTLPQIIRISFDDLLKIDGFKDKAARKVHEELQKIKQVDCSKLMVASNIFGRGLGDKKLQVIVHEFPYLMSDKKKALKLSIEDVKKIKGIADITARQFLEGLPKFYEFYESLQINCIDNGEKKVIEQSKIADKFRGKKIVFTGFRNTDYEKLIEDNGGMIMTSISSHTDYLVVKDITDTSQKIQKAKELGITIMSKNELENLLA